jgi:hypothetical protein
MLEKRGHLTKDSAEMLAIGALTFLAGRPEALERFLSLAGIGPAGLRAAAADPAFLAGVLDYLLGDEPLLVEYAARAAVPPADIAEARRALGQ